MIAINYQKEINYQKRNLAYKKKLSHKSIIIRGGRVLRPPFYMHESILLETVTLVLYTT